ncbi:MAG: BF3164 family lipoprotein [Algoriphagus sp.]|uniref:BF3164 family lipoprotein n=3 Tax=Algoriphagus sp. TaxID=1872435 RepID=UPI00329836F9
MKQSSSIGYLTIIIFSLILSCIEKDRTIQNTTITVNWDNFITTQNLNSIVLQNITDSMFIPTQIHISKNLLFVSEKSSDAILHILNIATGQYLGIHGTRGAGPGEVLNAWKLFSPDEETIGVFDPELGKAIVYDIDTLLNENKYSKEYLQSGMINSNGVSIVDENIYFLSNMNMPESRILYYAKTTQGLNLEKKGQLPTLDKKYPNFQAEEERSVVSHAKLINNDKIFVVSYYNIPMMTIYDIKSAKEISIVGPDKFPEPELFGNIRYYYSSYISKKYIYLLYIENKKEFDYTSSTILVFDHNGEPVKKLLLDTEIFQLAVYNDSTIYGLVDGTETSDFEVVKFQIE